jgi:hypothetical protein
VNRYGLVGERTRDFLTYGGLVLWHDNRAELEFLVPGPRVMELPRDLPADQCMPIRLHPDLAAVQWPLTRDQFVRKGA